MNDYGLNGDAFAGDGIFTTPVPQNVNSSDTKFYILASNNKAVQLSPQRAEYEFYMLPSQINKGTIDDKNEISLFPNPTQGVFCLKGDFIPLAKYEVLTSLGKRVMTGALNSYYNYIDLSLHSQGVYLVKIGGKTFKIIKTD